LLILNGASISDTAPVRALGPRDHRPRSREFRWFLFNSDDTLTTYHPDQRYISLTNTHIVEPPGQTFRYNKYHPQLLGVILERATGMSVTAWTQTRLWDPLGMQFDGAWTLDSTESGFEKMEAGLNARAIDFAKLGRLFLANGNWEGNQILSSRWIAVATGVDPAGRAPEFADDRYYALMWWGVPRDGAPPDYYAAGDHGQYIYVSPANDLIIVRTGNAYGITSREWVNGFARAADDLRSSSLQVSGKHSAGDAQHGHDPARSGRRSIAVADLTRWSKLDDQILIQNHRGRRAAGSARDGDVHRCQTGLPAHQQAIAVRHRESNAELPGLLAVQPQRVASAVRRVGRRLRRMAA
jgi:CubicO group peptidase (beta-lactamase class C family)